MGLGRDKDESLLEYQIRICSERVKLDLTWDEVAKILNEELGENYGESKYRKWWYAFNEGMDYVRSLEAEREETVKEYVGEQKKDFQMLKTGEQASTIVTKLNEEQLKDPDYLLKVHGYDPNEWELTSAKQSIWNNKLDNELYKCNCNLCNEEGKKLYNEFVQGLYDILEINNDINKKALIKSMDS